MKKLMLTGMVAVSVCCAYADDDTQKEHNAIIASDMINALKKVSESEEFLDWEVEFCKHIQKGILLVAKQARQYLSAEEQALVKKIIIALDDFIKLCGEYCFALRLAPTHESRLEIERKYNNKMQDKAAALSKLFAIFYNLPLDMIAQNEHQVESLLFAFMERICMPLSTALPAAAHELS